MARRQVALPMKRRGPARSGGALLVVLWTALALGLAWPPVAAGAHALLLGSIPADGETVDRAPPQVLLTFTEAPDPKLSTVHVLDASGRQVETGGAGPVPGQATQLGVPLGTLDRGVYTVTWRTTSADDGHTSAGTIAFGVGVPAPSAGFGGASGALRSPTPTAAAVAGRWLFYAGAVLLLGAAMVGVFVVADVGVVSGPALVGAWAAAAAGILLTVADQRATARASLGQLLGSATGHKLAAQVVAVGVTGLAVGWTARRRSRATLALVGVGGSAVMLARALAGHADASSARWFTVTVQWAHLVSVGAWVGGLAWLLLAIRRGDAGRGAGLARRFSAVAGATLAVVAVTGTLRAVDLVGAWDRLAHTSFGEALLVKVGLFAALVGLGAVSRFRHVPAAAVGGPGRRGLRRVVRGEVAIAAGVLGATAVLAGLPPPASLAAATRTAPIPTVVVTGNDQAASVRVRLVVTPGLPGPNRFDATLADYGSGRPVAADGVALRFQIDDVPGVAPVTLDLVRVAEGRWGGFGRPISIDGRWNVTAMVQTATDTVDVPMELTPRRPATTATPAAGADAAGACGDGQPDPAYTVTVDPEPNPPKLEATTLHLTVRRDGRAVTGAKVCVAADMPDMQHPGVNKVAKEASGGRYDAELKFGMGGAWAGSVTVAEPGRAPALITFKLQVT